MINTEPLWNEYSNYDDYLKLYSDVVGFPYTNDKKFNYIFLVDSSIGSSKGRFDEESLKELSKNYNVTFIISTEKPLVLPFNNTKLIIEPLSFAKIHNIVLQFYNNNNNNNRIADFFAALLKPTFLYSQYEFESNKSYYDLILHIYKAFNNSFDAYGHARTNEIFSLTLAKSTERKRFPSAMTDEDIEKWKRIVKRNEAFNLIRLPMNLSMALQMFELKGTIPINNSCCRRQKQTQILPADKQQVRGLVCFYERLSSIRRLLYSKLLFWKHRQPHYQIHTSLKFTLLHKRLKPREFDFTRLKALPL